MVTEKATSGLVVGLLAYIVGQVNLVVVAMVGFILIDFITGMMSAFKNGIGFNSDVATKGFIKKTGMLILWLVAVLLQLVLQEQGGTFGIDMTRPVIVMGITFYLIGSEAVSILQNLHEIGVVSPKWFKTTVKSVQDIGEKKKVK